MEFSKETSKKIRKVRRDLDMTQRDFSQAVGIPFSTYALKEKGHVKWNWDDICKISKYTSVKTDDLI